MAVKQVAVNKKAWHDYEVLKQVEAGLALLGSEIKSIRDGRVQIREAYARPEDGEFWLIGAHISQYAPAGITGHEPTRRPPAPDLRAPLGRASSPHGTGRAGDGWPGLKFSDRLPISTV